jgi:filamentous hemagglutinin family protein
MIKHNLPFLTTTALFFLSTFAHAQTYTPSGRIPVQDNSFGTEVTSTNNNFTITGGVSKGQNLFHSFTDFSVPTGRSVNFNNPSGTQSVITRVTGNSFSDINGEVYTNAPNFFLINPNGIVFGKNANIFSVKSFVATTAEGIDFVDRGGRTYNFGVTRSGDSSLLNVSSDVTFNPARLIINSNKSIDNYRGINTNNPGKYVGLIGGDINFYGGYIYAPAAKVELVALKPNATVGFSLDSGVQIPKNIGRGNVSLRSSGTQASQIYLASGGGGSVRIFAKDITLQGKDTRIQLGIAQGLGSKIALAGDIILDAIGNVQLDGAYLQNSVEGEGKGGGVTIAATNIEMIGGGRVSVGTKGKGDAGNIKIVAQGNVSFKDGVPVGDGKNSFDSGALSTVEKDATGNAGNIDIEARNLYFNNKSGLSTTSNGTGNAGKIKIIATEAVRFDGGINKFSAEVNAASFLLSDIGESGQGIPGGITIEARNISFTNGVVLTVGQEGKSNGIKGEGISLKGNIITLDRTGLFSNSGTAQAGDINITASDYLLMRNNSEIKTNSDSNNLGDNGGNITINSSMIVALPVNELRANDITANGNRGKGGEIKITTLGIFGIQQRLKGEESPRTNDITATSDFNQQGTVDIKTPGIDPGKDTGELPAATNDASNQISQTCSASRIDHKFYITGRGGLPPNASDPLESEALWSDGRAVRAKPVTSVQQPEQIAPPAVGWRFEPNGRVRLIAAQTDGEPTGTRVKCPGIGINY